MKKEKYISEKKRKTTTSWVVKIPYYIGTERRTYERAFSEADFGDHARSMAIYHRNEKVAEFQRGNTPQTAPTVRECFVRSLALFPRRAKTRKQHEYFLRQIGEIADTPIDMIRASDVQMSLNRYAETHTHDMTAKLLSVWRLIFKAAALDEIKVTDKTIGVTVPKDRHPVQKRKMTITPEEFAAFCDALLSYNEWDEVGAQTSRTIWEVLQVMYYTGIRPAEAFALTDADVDLEKGLISINKAVGGSSSGKPEIVPPKTANAIRSVPIPAPLAEILPKRRGFLFLIRGELISTDYFSNYIHLVSKKSGIEFRAYMLRHLFATDLQKTQPPRTVQDLLGHASFQMSVEYARSTEEERKEAVESRFS